jgi:aminopeptidase N
VDGDGATDYTTIHAFYREPAIRWSQAARYGQHAIRSLSEFTGTPYPWPHMTAVEGAGIIGGGMEFPMMTLIGDYTAAGDEALYNVTAHELAHMWVPMIVSVDERRYSWFDEGTTSFNENQVRKDIFRGVPSDSLEAEVYLRTARAGEEGEMMRRSAYHYPGPAFGVASYAKPATVLVALRGLLGEDTFQRAYHEFYDRWSWKHPYPWDLWATFEDVSGRDLDWFWRSWYYETWVLDQAIGEVSTGPGGTATITVEDRGEVPMPARLRITLESGAVIEREVPVETWLRGVRTASVTVDAPAPVVRVEIDAEHAFPDVDRRNNVWVR